MAVDTVTMETPAQPKHKWLAKGSRLAKKAVLAATTFGVMVQPVQHRHSPLPVKWILLRSSQRLVRFT